MPVSVLVTNQQPQSASDVPEALLKVFQAYTMARSGLSYLPFEHQAKTFRLLQNDEQVLLVAGTASGKTLAAAVPLFWKLSTGRIRRVLFMYPTIALMDDQRTVMDKLAEITGLRVGQIQGGMSRTRLMAALNNPVVLATPDEIYWFFRKNVKYSSLLIYGLALVDEFVLDEAHLFNGLMLRNLAHLRRRVQFLAERLGRCPRWHILTATPTSELRSLVGAVEVQGRSKCGDVAVTFQEPATSYAERQGKLLGAVESALAAGAQKVLLVFNSAELAHRVFEHIKGKSPPDLPLELKWRFGRVRWRDLKAWLLQDESEAAAVEEMERWLERDEPVRLRNLADGTEVSLPVEELVARVARLLESQGWALKRLIYAATRQAGTNLAAAIEGKLSGRLLRLLWKETQRWLGSEAELAPNPSPNPSPARGGEMVGAEGTWAERTTDAVDRWLSETQSAVEKAWNEATGDLLQVTAPGFAEITAGLRKVGLSEEWAEAITTYLKHTMELPEGTSAKLATPPRDLAQRQVAFSWLEWLVSDGTRRGALLQRLQQTLERGDLQANTRHIATWRGTNTPVIIYTGKMSKAERKGLIEAFAALPQAVLISTPAVEVGVDFAADTLITEQCDGHAFLQRFGRVGRRPGIPSQVNVLLKDGETYVRLYQRHQPRMAREAFSDLIANPAGGLFRARRYAEGSALLDATHWEVNAQLGQIGHWLNQAMFGQGEVAGLARDLQRATLPFAYGLRTTLPGVSLRGGVGGGDPFYILRKVPNDRLFSSDSPFEIGQADMTYLEFLWKRSVWKSIAVDVPATLEASQAIFWSQDGQWHLRAGYGIVADYVRLFNPIIARNLEGLKDEVQRDLTKVSERLRPHSANPKVRLILQVGEALYPFFCPAARFIVGQGDVYLVRIDQKDIAGPVEDALGNPLLLPDQTWLLLYGYGEQEARQLLQQVSALDWEEVIYDWATLGVQGARVIGPLLLDRVAGACFDIYRRLVDHAHP